MFFTADEHQQIKQRAKHIPMLYVQEMTRIIESVINKDNIYISNFPTQIITKEDYD